MAGLNSMMFYKVKFSISGANSSEDILWKIVMHIKNWQVKKCAKRHLKLTREPRDWTRLKRGGQIFSEDRSVFFKSEYFHDEEKSAQYWACQVIENLPPPPGYAHREWVTEVGYEQQEENMAVFSCVVSYSDRAGFIGPYTDTPDPSIPNLIRNIITDQSIRVSCGPDILTGSAIRLKVGDWPEFYGRITNPDRQLPYIFIGPQAGDAHLVDPHKLADRLFGNALIFFTCDPEFAQEMRYMNDDYACYEGSIRVYQPKINDPVKHRYLSAADIEAYGEEQVVSFLVRAFAQNVHFYDSFFCIEECQKKKAEYHRGKRLAILHAAHQKQLEQAEDEKSVTFDLAVQEEEKRLKAESEAERLRQELANEQRETSNLRAHIECLQVAAEQNSGLRRAVNARFQVAALPDTQENVALYFGQMFADKLVFTEDARRSIKYCTLPPDELWKIFFALANTMCDLYRETGSGDIFAAFRKKTGIPAKRGEGAATRNDNKLMRQFQTDLDGETIDIEAHITYPKEKQSIHFGYSPRLKKLVIGHCGEHLDNYSTRKQNR